MRFIEHRTTMGGSSEAQAHLNKSEAQPPSHRLFITPRAEVETLCRCALVRYLEGCDPQLASAAKSILEYPDRQVARREIELHTWARLGTAMRRVRAIDPACGEGHMLIGALDLFDQVIGHVERALGTEQPAADRRLAIVQHNLYGIEAQPETLSRAHQRLRAAVGGTEAATKQVVACNLLHGDSLLARDASNRLPVIDRFMPTNGFHLVLGNPPYVRHEKIADPFDRIPAEDYKRLIFASVQSRLDDLANSEPALRTVRPVLSRRSDLSLLFTLYGLTLLTTGGVLGYVVPTALYTAQYGGVLWQVLQAGNFESERIEDLARRAFADAAVNTGLLVAQRRTHTAGISGRSDVASVRSVTVGTPHAHRSSRATSDRGGLGALLDRIQGTCAPLSSMGRLRYPIKTGLNRFFYPDASMRVRFEIEAAFLIPVVKSPRDVRNLVVSRDELPSVLFCCPHTPEQLRRLGATGALAYVQWGAKQYKTVHGEHTGPTVRWPLLPSFRGRRPWYAIGLPAAPHVLCPRFIHRRFFFALPENGIVADQTFYGLELDPELLSRRLLLGCLMNSSLTYLLMETNGRTGLGDGVRQFALADTARLPIPDPDRVASGEIPKLTRCFMRLAARPLRPIEEEVCAPDRQELDDRLCRALGLSTECGAAARRHLPMLVHQRLARAGSA